MADMTQLSNYAENELLDHLLGTGSWTAPTNTYLQFHTADPGEDCTSAVAANNVRQLLSWAVASGGSISTNANIAYTATAAETITHWSMWDASSAGNPIAYDAFAAGAAFEIDDSIRVDSGDLTLSTLDTMILSSIADDVLDHLTGRAAWTVPAGSFVKLHTGDPGSAGTANPATETDRISATFAAASAGTTDNTGTIDWTAVAASETVTHFTIHDAATAGTPTLRGSLTSRALTSGEDASFADGALDLTLT